MFRCNDDNGKHLDAFIKNIPLTAEVLSAFGSIEHLWKKAEGRTTLIIAVRGPRTKSASSPRQTRHRPLLWKTGASAFSKSSTACTSPECMIRTSITCDWFQRQNPIATCFRAAILKHRSTVPFMPSIGDPYCRAAPPKFRA